MSFFFSGVTWIDSARLTWMIIMSCITFYQVFLFVNLRWIKRNLLHSKFLSLFVNFRRHWFKIWRNFAVSFQIRSQTRYINGIVRSSMIRSLTEFGTQTVCEWLFGKKKQNKTEFLTVAFFLFFSLGNIWLLSFFLLKAVSFTSVTG